QGVAKRLADSLRARFPGIRIVGTHTPPFRDLTEDEDRSVVNEINTTVPDIVWVGLSSPKQERWMAVHLGRLQAPVMVGVGAAFDFLSGTKPQAPPWIQSLGLEWLFRLATEPQRLWPRYRQYPRFAVLALAQVLGLKRFPDG
ncbi:MAG: WecB/TagA/CpsF family glycosyltransferase, partial [Anaerolineales bacterium]|nr:WecB/TagA/CpsF family glycosyltransferase [Anaerolineales bacterium]